MNFQGQTSPVSFAFVFTCTAITGTNLTVDVELKIFGSIVSVIKISFEEVIQNILSVLGDMLWVYEWKKTTRSELSVKRFCFFNLFCFWATCCGLTIGRRRLKASWP